MYIKIRAEQQEVFRIFNAIICWTHEPSVLIPIKGQVSRDSWTCKFLSSVSVNFLYVYYCCHFERGMFQMMIRSL